MKQHGINGVKSLIAINPVAKWETKLWPNKKFAELADMLIDQYDMKIVFTGGIKDYSIIQAITSSMKGLAINFAGETTLTELAALYEKAALVISTDTGPMHLAAAMGTPVVALFGPTAPWRTGPYGTNHHVISAELECSPCFKRRCETRDCMYQISVKQVMDRRHVEFLKKLRISKWIFPLVIVNWNTKILLLDCLASVYKTVKNISMEIWVVDNASSDGSMDAVQWFYPDTKIIQNSKNLGFAAANNRAFKRMRGRYALLLNTDTVLTEGAVETIYNFMVKHHPDVGMACGQLLNQDGSKQNSFANFPSLAAFLIFGVSAAASAFSQKISKQKKCRFKTNGGRFVHRGLHDGKRGRHGSG